MTKYIGIYPGTFDPITLGHLDITKRASRLFDSLIVGISEYTPSKNTLFSLEKRLEMAKHDISLLKIDDKPFIYS